MQTGINLDSELIIGINDIPMKPIVDTFKKKASMFLLAGKCYERNDEKSVETSVLGYYSKPTHEDKSVSQRVFLDRNGVGGVDSVEMCLRLKGTVISTSTNYKRYLSDEETDSYLVFAKNNGTTSVMHREDGPAQITTRNGNYIHVVYYLNSDPMDLMEWCEHTGQSPRYQLAKYGKAIMKFDEDDDE